MREKLYLCAQNCKMNIANCYNKTQNFRLTKNTKHMKKLFTLAAAVLASLSLMAADFEPTAVYTIGDSTTLGAQWKTGQNNPKNFYTVGDTTIFSPYILYQSAATGWQEWTGCAGSGSTGTTWNAQGVFKGSSVWFTTSAKAATTRSTRQYFYHVTNCTATQIFVKSGSSSVIMLAAYEIVAGVPSETAAKSATYNTGSNGILEITGLDASKTYRIVVNSDKDSNSNYYEIAFVKGPDKEVKSTLVELTAVKINGEPLEANQVASLKENKSLALGAEYVEAPTVTFTATTTVTYIDETQKITNSDIPVVATEVGGKWQAQTTINVNTYTVTAIKPTSYTVNYYDGEILLGSEIVKAGESATKYAGYTVKPLFEFVAWYTDQALTQAVTSWTINANTNVYGKWTKAYAKCMNIEQIVLDKGVKFDIATAMADAGYDLKNSNGGLDSLNDEKTERNEPYLGLKLKKTGDYIRFNLKNGDSLAVKIGHIESDLMVISEGDTAYISKEIHEIRMKADNGDDFVQFITTTDKTLVFKQIMINKDFDPVILPAQTKFEASVSKTIEHGTVTLGKDKKSSVIVNEGDTVIINVTPDEGYKVGAVTAGNAAVLPVAGVYSFVMPGQDTEVSAEFILADDTTYIITISESITNGYVVPDKYQAKAGDTITLTITPNEGYELEAISLEGIDLAIIVNGNTATFVMPKQNVTVLATFKAKTQTLYTVTLGTYEHGNVAFIEPNAENKYAEGAEVRLSVTPDEGYELEAISLEGIDLAISVVDGVASFNMPKQNVTVLATFKAKTEGFENTQAGAKAVKVMRDGKLFIEKNGKTFDITGAELR